MSLLDARRVPPLTFARESRSSHSLPITGETCMRRLALALVVVAVASGCAGGGAGRGHGPRTPAPVPDDVPDPASTTTIYRGVGRLGAADPLPFVGTLAFAAGGGDTALALLGLSLANRALNFQRQPIGYLARYRVDITLPSNFRRPPRMPASRNRARAREVSQAASRPA